MTSATSAWVSVVSGKTDDAVLTWSVAKNTFTVDTARFAYTGDKASVLSFVLLLTVLCLTGRYSCLANPAVHLRRFLGVFQKVVES